jgi:intracellular sulfur oxidation DsrE/DsrF family protein
MMKRTIGALWSATAIALAQPVAAQMGGMAGMQGMGGMAGMQGMRGMAGMPGMAGMYAPVMKQRVVYHINGDDAAQQKAALGNIQNHINAVGKDNLDLKVVLHGDGISLLLYPDAKSKTKMKAANATEELQARITGLKGQGVQIQVCANTLKGRDVQVSDLYDVGEADIVPSGVAQLGILQAQGYAYIKP